jgi:hypothetical protein
LPDTKKCFYDNETKLNEELERVSKAAAAAGGDAIAAKQEAEAAKSAADDAKTKAGDADSTAGQALEAAGAAQKTADNAIPNGAGVSLLSGYSLTKCLWQPDYDHVNAVNCGPDLWWKLIRKNP